MTEMLLTEPLDLKQILLGLKRIVFSSPGLCPWRAYVVTQALTSASIGVAICVSTMFKFSKVSIVF